MLRRPQFKPHFRIEFVDGAGIFLLYGVGIAISLVLPTLGVVLYLFVALYLGIPGRTLHRMLRRRNP